VCPWYPEKPPPARGNRFERTATALLPRTGCFVLVCAETVTGPPARTPFNKPVFETVALAGSLVVHLKVTPTTGFPLASYA
jgi:hypothetical protein